MLDAFPRHNERLRIPPEADAEKISALNTQEHQHAAELQRAGKWVHLWRVAGKSANISIFQVESADELQAILEALPLRLYIGDKRDGAVSSSRSIVGHNVRVPLPTGREKSLSAVGLWPVALGPMRYDWCEDTGTPPALPIRKRNVCWTNPLRETFVIYNYGFPNSWARLRNRPSSPLA